MQRAGRNFVRQTVETIELRSSLDACGRRGQEGQVRDIERVVPEPSDST